MHKRKRHPHQAASCSVIEQRNVRTASSSRIRQPLHQLVPLGVPDAPTGPEPIGRGDTGTLTSCIWETEEDRGVPRRSTAVARTCRGCPYLSRRNRCASALESGHVYQTFVMHNLRPGPPADSPCHVLGVWQYVTIPGMPVQIDYDHRFSHIHDPSCRHGNAPAPLRTTAMACHRR